MGINGERLDDEGWWLIHSTLWAEEMGADDGAPPVEDDKVWWSINSLLWSGEFEE